LRHSLVKELLWSSKSTKEEAHSHYEKQIGQDTANEGCLDNDDFFLSKGDDSND
jgi:hypothetical protein